MLYQLLATSMHRLLMDFNSSNQTLSPAPPRHTPAKSMALSMDYDGRRVRMQSACTDVARVDVD
ncbi:hypothetical protein K443DRAFT_344207 [Laccaria amethystina LaAM-08-1]|uniref:Uncharacterized protein n=1 Tax=Laccaria amethystina LaAM-08-1 TaxID=1095629 RepID=A0A0C9XKJ4_9AGAR|nr:hypothetical protein K443DRAFT_344207 [Laccaria amethystina LaAM-08-1]